MCKQGTRPVGTHAQAHYKMIMILCVKYKNGTSWTYDLFAQNSESFIKYLVIFYNVQ